MNTTTKKAITLTIEMDYSEVNELIDEMNQLQLLEKHDRIDELREIMGRFVNEYAYG